jgi:hypothetical protein
MAAYDKGTATVPVKIAAGRYSVDSFRGEGSYEVNVKTGTCNCPHFTGRLAGTGLECKHLQAARQARAAELAAKAAALTPAELTALLPRYADRPEVAAAIKGALAGRWTSRKLSGPNSDAEAFGGAR